jgi:hypothetical protein
MDWKRMSAKAKRAALAAAERRRAEATPGAMARTPSMPGEGLVGAEIGGMQAAELDPRTAGRLQGLGGEAGYLLPMEARKAGRSGANIQSMQRMLDFLPKAKELAAVMKAGGAKRGWYRASAQAIMDTFGPDDAPRFAGLLAALSPQTSVESNLTNALNVWKNWTAAGRPTDDDAILRIMGQSVQGNKGDKSVMEAWRNNAGRALKAEDPTKIVLSGPKVDSFMGNLLDDVFRVTNDTWNANLLGVTQNVFSGGMTKANPLDPGMTPGYLATSARMRRAGDIAGMTPSEGQETAWSFAMQLYEQAKKTGMSVTDLLDTGGATDELIRGAPDFSSLFQQPQYRGILEQAGYGEKLGAMQPHQWPEMGGDIRQRLDPEELKLVRQATQRLDALMDQRARESYAKSFWGQTEQPENIPVAATFETTPYGASGHLTGWEGMTDKAQRTNASNLASPLRDFADLDMLHQSLGLKQIPTKGATGSWVPQGGAAEVNPAFAAGVQVPVTKAGELRGADQRRLEAAEAARAYMTAQGGGAFSGIVPGGEGGFFVPREGKINPAQMKELVNDPRMAGTVAADTGTGLNVFNPQAGAVPQEAQLALRQRLATQGVTKADEAPYTKLPTLAPGAPVGGYIDLEQAWQAPPGTGAVARELFSRVDQLPGNQQRALSKAMQQPAGDLFDVYRGLNENKGLPVREDLMNALKILREQGLEGLREAMMRGDFIADMSPLLGPGGPLLPAMSQESWV